MSAELYPVAGSRFFIGGPIASKTTDFSAADFAAQSWVEVDGYENMGSMGDTAALISTDLINRGRTTKQKGTKNAGSRQDQFAVISDDPGQIALIAAGGSNSNYAFRIVLNDDTDVLTNPSERLFIGLVMGTPEPGGSANTVVMMTATIEINSNIVRVAAS